LGAALLDLADEADELREEMHAAVLAYRQRRKSKTLWQRFLRLLKLMVWFLVGSLWVFGQQFTLWWNRILSPSPWDKLRKLVSPSKTPARTLSCTAAGTVAQAKQVARVMSTKQGVKVTLNDVFVAAVTRALIRQLEHHQQVLEARRDVDEATSSSFLPSPSHLTVVLPVHLKGGILLPNDSIGNQIGAVAARVPCGNENTTAADRLHAVHNALATVKQSPAALWSFGAATWATRLLPSSWVASLFRRAAAGASVVVTNVRGPDRILHYQGRPVETIQGFLPLPPGIPVGVTVNSYNGQVQLGLTAETWAVPNGDQFLAWVLEEYLEMVQAASALASN
jgi:hypothetical protein